MQKRNVSLLSISMFFAIIIVILTIIVVDGFWIHETHNAFLKNSDAIKKLFVNEKKYQLKSSVDKLIQDIESKRDIAFYDLRQTVYFNTNNAVKIINNIYNAGKYKYSATQIQKMLISFFNNSRFYNNKGFYLFLTKNGQILNSSTIRLDKETTRKYQMLYNDFYEGFIDGKIIDGKEFVSYAKLFKPLNMYISACIFEDDFEEKIKSNIIFILAKKNALSKKNDYIFINDIKGNIIIFYDKIYNNNIKLWDLYQNSSKKEYAKEVFKKELKAYNKEGGDYIEYNWIEPKIKRFTKKISFIRGYKKWGWIIGKGFYEDDVFKAITQLKYNLKLIVLNIIKNSYILVFFLSITFFAIMYMIFRHTDKRIKQIFDKLEEALKTNKKLDDSKYHIVQLKNMVQYINEAINRFKEYEDEFLEAFAYSMEARDTYTKGHSQRVAYYAQIIAKTLGLDYSKQQELHRAGLLHDIGKIGIPDNILLKPGKLTFNEYSIIKHHSLFSYEIVSKIEQFKSMANYIRHHHERCDGKGYPDGLKCSEIEVEAKILAIADVFDALTSKRTYRNKLSPKQAMEILKKEQLDQEIITKIGSVLIENCIKESGIEIKLEQTKEIEKVRKEMFDIDYMTGLKRRKVLIQEANKLIQKKYIFAVLMVDIKGLSFINYEFSTEAGDKLIVYSALALSEILEKQNYAKQKHISRAYNDAFLFLIDDETLIKQINVTSTTIKKQLKAKVKELFNENDKNIYINERNESIGNFIDYHMLYSIYPYDSDNIERLIYLCAAKKESFTKKQY